MVYCLFIRLFLIIRTGTGNTLRMPVVLRRSLPFLSEFEFPPGLRGKDYLKKATIRTGIRKRTGMTTRTGKITKTRKEYQSCFDDLYRFFASSHFYVGFEVP